ncbi:MAG: hypothetical protein J6B03_08750 [Candidatus Homeothermus sp.]|nr:hypothetical protein [Candidatus Homeothermus sp.]
MELARYKKAFLVLAIVFAAAVLAEMIISICVTVVESVIVAVTVLLFCLAQTLYRNAVKAEKENKDLTDNNKR